MTKPLNAMQTQTLLKRLALPDEWLYNALTKYVRDDWPVKDRLRRTRALYNYIVTRESYNLGWIANGEFMLLSLGLYVKHPHPYRQTMVWEALDKWNTACYTQATYPANQPTLEEPTHETVQVAPAQP